MNIHKSGARYQTYLKHNPEEKERVDTLSKKQKRTESSRVVDGDCWQTIHACQQECLSH